MEQENKKKVIDVMYIFHSLWDKRKLFVKVGICTFIISCAIILPIPRTYHTEVTAAPEQGAVDGSALTSIASSFGINIGDGATTDAFYPDIYPDVMASNGFISKLLKARVRTIDGKVETDYYTYLLKHQKKTFYKIPINWCKKQIKNLLDPPRQSGAGFGADSINTFMLSEIQAGIFELARNNIGCSVDKKTGIITISVNDQDPLVCATMADSAMWHLQNFITLYRTNKARVDYEFYKQLTAEMRQEYEQALKVYSDFCDANRNAVMQSYLSQRDKLENDLQIKLGAYNTMNTQLIAARSKVQERTPAFSLLQGPSVPNKPSKPKRMIFVLAMLVLSTMVTSVVVLREYLLTFL